jgi:hypothetical protein
VRPELTTGAALPFSTCGERVADTARAANRRKTFRTNRLEKSDTAGDAPTVPAIIARQIDDRRRLVLPEHFPALSAVSVATLDEDTLIVRKATPLKGVRIIAVPIIENLPSDPEWDKVEEKLGAAAGRDLPEPTE